jgi:hypothetical protein
VQGRSRDDGRVRRTDKLVGTVGPDVIAGHGGADVIRGGGGQDLICDTEVAGVDRIAGGR